MDREALRVEIKYERGQILLVIVDDEHRMGMRIRSHDSQA
jgi:hypothetical protein